MSYLWYPALPIQMELHNDVPQRFHWRGRWHRVNWHARRWRVDVGWWHLRVWRDYHKLVTHTGLLVLIYQDLLTQEWYLQRVYD
jgi:hypothetical protein